MGARGATGQAVLAAEPASVAEARRELRRTLDGAGVAPPKQQSALLVVSELVANAVKHGSRPGGQIALAWTVDGEMLKIAVVDPAAAGSAPAVLPVDAEREEGRGMLIVDRLADRWDDRVLGGNRRVSVRVRI